MNLGQNSEKQLKIVAVVPARMGSSRFPGKPIANILGYPMIEHVRRRALRAELLDEVYVATCDDEIRSVVEAAGGKVIMTSNKHERCTDRVEEAARKIDADIVINIQGDEPMVSRAAIEDVVKPFFDDPSLQITNIVYPVEDHEELASVNVVKTVLSRSGKMLYLSRSCLPGNYIDKNITYYKQTGIIAFRKEFLHKYSELEPTPLEEKESVDVLRLLEHDFCIQGVISRDETLGVDIPEQVGIIEAKIKSSESEIAIVKEIFPDVKI